VATARPPSVTSPLRSYPKVSEFGTALVAQVFAFAPKFNDDHGVRPALLERITEQQPQRQPDGDAGHRTNEGAGDTPRAPDQRADDAAGQESRRGDHQRDEREVEGREDAADVGHGNASSCPALCCAFTSLRHFSKWDVYGRCRLDQRDGNLRRISGAPMYKDITHRK
jgi:hypothetical protein